MARATSPGNRSTTGFQLSPPAPSEATNTTDKESIPISVLIIIAGRDHLNPAREPPGYGGRVTDVPTRAARIRLAGWLVCGH